MVAEVGSGFGTERRHLMDKMIIWAILIIMTIADVFLITKFDDHWRRIGIGNLIFTIVIAVLVMVAY